VFKKSILFIIPLERVAFCQLATQAVKLAFAASGNMRVKLSVAPVTTSDYFKLLFCTSWNLGTDRRVMLPHSPGKLRKVLIMPQPESDITDSPSHSFTFLFLHWKLFVNFFPFFKHLGVYRLISPPTPTAVERISNRMYGWRNGGRGGGVQGNPVSRLIAADTRSGDADCQTRENCHLSISVSVSGREGSGYPLPIIIRGSWGLLWIKRERERERERERMWTYIMQLSAVRLTTQSFGWRRRLRRGEDAVGRVLRPKRQLKNLIKKMFKKFAIYALQSEKSPRRPPPNPTCRIGEPDCCNFHRRWHSSAEVQNAEPKVMCIFFFFTKRRNNWRQMVRVFQRSRQHKCTSSRCYFKFGTLCWSVMLIALPLCVCVCVCVCVCMCVLLPKLLPCFADVVGPAAGAISACEGAPPSSLPLLCDAFIRGVKKHMAALRVK